MKLRINKLDEVLDRLPGSIYWKDRDGIYLGRNRYSLLKCQAIGCEDEYSTRDSIIGKTDFDYLPRKTAEFFRDNDSLVIQTQSEIIQNESILLPNNITLMQISCKKPLYDKCGYIIGIIGNTIDVTSFGNTSLKNDSNVSLTKRQLDCLYYLVKGMTKKQIGKIMELSHRTIEDYLDLVKYKLKCRTKTDLITKALEIDSIKIRLMSS